jgi:hypothetical protein
MRLFSKRRISYVFIFYRNAAPTPDDQKEIIAAQAKGRKLMEANRAWMSDEPAVAFAEAHQISDGDWFQPAAVRDAQLEALCAIWMAKNGIGTSGKGEEFRAQQVNGYIVATQSQDLVPMK